MMIWRKIDSAPRDGRRLLLWVPKTNKGLVIGRWDKRAVTHDSYIDGWWLEGFDLPFDKPPYYPTHWQLLPDMSDLPREYPNET